MLPAFHSQQQKWHWCPSEASETMGGRRGEQWGGGARHGGSRARLPDLPFPWAFHAENYASQIFCIWVWCDADVLWVSQDLLSSPKNVLMLNGALPSAFSLHWLQMSIAQPLGHRTFQRGINKDKASANPKKENGLEQQTKVWTTRKRNWGGRKKWSSGFVSYDSLLKSWKKIWSWSREYKFTGGQYFS